MHPSDSPTSAADSSPEATVERVVDVALTSFARQGYSGVKLEDVARDAGISKRMLHYHFGDKRGLYEQSLQEALSRLQPPESALQLDTSVPVEGVRRLIDALCECFFRNPESIRLIVNKDLPEDLRVGEQAPVADISALTMHLDRLLMLGQDAGAFRPGISSDDIFVLISSLASFRITNQEVMLNLSGVDMTTETNSKGVHRMMVDAVLAFLTSNIPDSGHSSYLVPYQSGDEPQSRLGIYSPDEGHDLFGEN